MTTQNDPGHAAAVAGLPGDQLGWHLLRAHTVAHREWLKRLEPLEITQSQAATLRLVSSNKGISQSMLCSILAVDRASMAVAVDRLEARGLVERTAAAGDRRRQELTLTAAGAAVLKKVRATVARHEDELARAFAPGERDALVQLLRRIYEPPPGRP
jgi:DNA-binding MarR family transcriptional regulator